MNTLKNQIEIPKNDEFEKLVNNLAYFQNAEGNNELHLRYNLGYVAFFVSRGWGLSF